jgi:hypothetical protein
MNEDKAGRWLQIALTITALEFFGPAIRDFSPSHAFHPDWVGHARVHLVWLLGFMLLSGVVNVYLIWFRAGALRGRLVLSAVWQSCNLGGFWIAYLLVPVYGGVMSVPGIHAHIFGMDENVFVFSVLSLVMLGVWAALASGRPTSGRPSEVAHA